MTLNHRKSAFITLGSFLKQFSTTEITKNNSVPYNDLFFDRFTSAIEQAGLYNGWFSRENILFACESWSDALSEENLSKWLNNYDFSAIVPKKVAIIMAGNIPLVGFHDFLSVLISGHEVIVKQSSNDTKLLPILAEYLQVVSACFEQKINFSSEKLPEFDAVIATGSDNTARYFEYYFGQKPHIIRRNRNSVAVLTGTETKEELEALGEDIFRYYGLGCRNVSKLFVPEGYDFDAFFKAIYSYHPIVNEDKYANNYDYNKAVYLMSLIPLLENGFLMLKEDTQYASPIATLFTNLITI